MRTIDEIRADCEAATPGPWYSTEDAVECRARQRSPFVDQGASIVARSYTWVQTVIEGGAQDEQGGAVGVLRNADAAFIANARQDIPDLLAALAEKNAEIASYSMAQCCTGSPI